ncbi:MAG: BON domain-containing protein [Verrucomicrobiota bacterium]
MKFNTNKFIIILGVTGFLSVGNALHASETDDRIEAAAKDSYVFRTFLKEDAVKTESNDGAVTLTGTVSQAFHKSLAQDTVENLPSVKSVDNRLKVSAENEVEKSDKQLVLKVKAALSFHRNVNAGVTDVTAGNGTVTLKGESTSIAQKELTTEYARDVDGVNTVKNEMKVAEAQVEPARTIAEKIDDASITAQIKGTLLAHRSTSALMTGIKTRDGVVTVSGISRNPSEKSLVTKLIKNIQGVITVTNNMSIMKPSTTKG